MQKGSVWPLGLHASCRVGDSSQTHSSAHPAPGQGLCFCFKQPEPQRSISESSSWEPGSKKKSTAQHSGGTQLLLLSPERDTSTDTTESSVVYSCHHPPPGCRLFKLILAAARAICTTFPTFSLSPPLGTELPYPHGEIPFSPCWGFAGKHNQHSVVGVRRASFPAMLHVALLSCGLPRCCHPERNTNAGSETQTLHQPQSLSTRRGAEHSQSQGEAPPSGKCRP